ncbi:GIY-YIG nuclease family protein [Candidatus Kaiserbacteria bacterium]|nr:GIY-YIG nuclease family protein [Candidatus Kaiserbacteria bacterium]
MAWVYILKTKSGKFYIGSTENLDTRLKHHLRGATPSTKRLQAEALLLKQEYSTIEDARVVEKKIKKLKRHDYIEKMVKDGYIRLLPR